ncbi:hypothetical protein PR202_gb08099 [Eleusine coracana subsp. coracana]|uniref:SMP domain-containing protein n=1 Tax=Eleusine coracana subsp. coracana TaxID=191504 RepID=A0AAV5EC57_ELECO|nr:hypothetical protein PR202_gb08099 [Eleusine coracana subsp. coracana]
MMRDAEDAALDRTPSGGAAAVMQSAAARNQRLGVMGETENLEAAHDADERSMAISEARVPGGRVVTEFVADQVVARLNWLVAAFLKVAVSRSLVFNKMPIFRVKGHKNPIDPISLTSRVHVFCSL